MIGRLPVIAAYLGLAMVGVNLVGADPADALFLAIAAGLLLFRPTALLFPEISTGGKVGVLIFLSCYVISCVIGYRATFILYLVTGMAMAFAVGYYTSQADRFRLGNALFFGFIGANIIVFVLWFLGIWPTAVFFDLFRDGRYLGAMGDPNFTGLMAAFTLYFLLDRLQRPPPRRSTMLLNAAATALALMMLLFSQSRAAWAAAAGGLAIQLIASRQLFAFRTIAAMFGVVAIAMVLATSSTGHLAGDVGSVTDRLQTIFVQTDSAEQERFQFLYTRVSLDVGLRHPLGVGPGMTFAYTGLLNGDGEPIGAHNAYVEILTENGWGAACAFVTLLTVAWFRLLRLAAADAFLDDISCRTILGGLTATGLFGMGHDLLAWRIGWIFPILSILAAFSKRYEAVTVESADRAG